MTIWFSADHHFGHRRILEYAKRPFASVEEMDAQMLANWNSAVSTHDRVYYLGDLSLNKHTALEMLQAMNGDFYYIRGNHDRRSPRSSWPLVWVKDYFDLKIEEQHIVLCHYPFDTWNKAHYGSWHLHGHSHGSLQTNRGGRLDVGVDAHDFLPWSFDEVQERLGGQAHSSVDHHGRDRNEFGICSLCYAEVPLADPQRLGSVIKLHNNVRGHTCSGSYMLPRKDKQ